MEDLKLAHESEIEPLSRQIDILQAELEEAMKKRMTLITRHVREVKAKEEEISRLKKKSDNFERIYAERRRKIDFLHLSSSSEEGKVKKFLDYCS